MDHNTGDGPGALFAPAHPGTEVLQAPQLAARLRADLFTALDSVSLPNAGPKTGPKARPLAAGIGAALVQAICARISLQIMSSGVRRTPAPTGARDLVLRAKAMILADSQCLIDNRALAAGLGPVGAQHSVGLCPLRSGQPGGLHPHIAPEPGEATIVA